MGALFDRAVVADVGTLRVSGLRIAFKVEKTLTKDPNTLDLVIYNLAASTRRQMQTPGAAVRLTAGYVGNVELLFSGDATIINHTRNGPDWVTRIQCGDGVKALRTARVNESFAPGTSVGAVLQRIAERTGLALGNTLDEIKKGNVRNALTEFSKGFVTAGIAGDELDKLAATFGREFSVQDGAIQLSTPGEAVGDLVVDLRADAGLIGSPEVAEASADKKRKRTIVKARSLIQQKLSPGRKVKLTSAAIAGFFRVEKVTFSGDTHAAPWYADLELSAV